jgi:GAF domain-containing protein
MTSSGFPQETFKALDELFLLSRPDDVARETMKRVVELVQTALPGCSLAGVTLLTGSEVETVVHSDPQVLEVDQKQYDLNEGPCLDALRRGVMLQSEDVVNDARWPRYSQMLAEYGIKSTLSVPLRVESATTGVLNLYCTEQRQFSDLDHQVVDLFAARIAIGLANLDLYKRRQKVIEQLEEAVQSRDVIGQAKGILIEREGITDDAAFEMLKNASQTQNVKLREVARRVVDEAQRAAQSRP